jgi:hypothetical protein
MILDLLNGYDMVFRVALEADHGCCSPTCGRFAEIHRRAPINPHPLPMLAARDIPAAFIPHDGEIISHCPLFRLVDGRPLA